MEFHEVGIPTCKDRGGCNPVLIVDANCRLTDGTRQFAIKNRQLECQ